MNEADEDVSVDGDGVALRKTLNDHQFETLAVVFDIRSSRESPAGVTIRDAIPDGVAAEDIGFHPEYGGDNWRAEGDEVVFSRTFAPGEQYTTVYGIREFEAPRSALLGEPTLVIDGAAIEREVEGIDELVAEEDSDMVREVIAGERNALPGMGGGPDPTATEPVSTGDDLVESAEADAGWGADEQAQGDDGPEPADFGGAEGPAAGDDASGDAWGDEAADLSTVEEPADAADDGTVAPEAAEAEGADEEAVAVDDEAITVPATGGVARVLAKELRAGNVSREDRRLLREALLPDEGSTDARIKRLQTQMADLAAYTDALEAFLDDEGGAEAILGELEDDLDSLADDVEDVEHSVSDAVDSVTDLSADVESVEDDVDDVATELQAVGDTTARLDDDVAELRSSVGELDDLDRRLGRVEDDVSAIMDQLEELATFRDRLSSVFGAGGMGGGSMGGDADDDRV